MKNILILILIFSLIGCNKKEVNNISVSSIISEIESNFPIENATKEDVKTQDIAERYGISISDIEEGTVYYTLNPDSADKVIIVKGKDKKNIESIERAMSSEIVGMGDAWRENEKESKKVDKHIFKTKDTYVMLCVSDDAEQIEVIFDSLLDKK